MVRPGLAIDEIQHAVMGAAKAIAHQQAVGVADEIAISEEKQFDQVEHRLLRQGLVGSSGAGGRGQAARAGGLAVLSRLALQSISMTASSCA